MKNNEVSKVKPRTIENTSIEEMFKSLGIFIALLSRFGAREKYNYALHGETVVQFARTVAAVECAHALISGHEDSIRFLLHLSDVERCLFSKDKNLSTISKSPILKQFIRELHLDNWPVPAVISMRADVPFTVDEDFLKLILNCLLFKTPKWLRAIRNSKLSEIGPQFSKVGAIVGKPKHGLRYNYFITDGTNFDINITNIKFGTNYWHSSTVGDGSPVLDVTPVRIFKINLNKGRKTNYKEIPMGSEEYKGIIPSVPRINASAKLASPEKLAELTARFATK